MKKTRKRKRARLTRHKNNSAKQLVKKKAKLCRRDGIPVNAVELAPHVDQPQAAELMINAVQFVADDGFYSMSLQRSDKYEHLKLFTDDVYVLQGRDRFVLKHVERGLRTHQRFVVLVGYWDHRIADSASLFDSFI